MDRGIPADGWDRWIRSSGRIGRIGRIGRQASPDPTGRMMAHGRNGPFHTDSMSCLDEAATGPLETGGAAGARGSKAAHAAPSSGGAVASPPRQMDSNAPDAADSGTTTATNPNQINPSSIIHPMLLQCNLIDSNATLMQLKCNSNATEMQLKCN